MTIIKKIRAEIERRIEEYDNQCLVQGHIKMAALQEDTLSFLDTLESEKPMNQDGLEEEAVSYCFDNGLNLSPRVSTDFARHFAEWGYLRAAEKYNEIEYNRQRAEESVPKDLEGNSEIPNNHDGIDKKAGKRLRRVCNLAEELKEDRPLEERLQELKEIRAKKGLDEAAEEAATEVYTYTFQGMDDLIGLFKAGAKWQKNQMLKEAVEAEISAKFPIVGRSLISVIGMLEGFKYGDKVRIIIVKE